MKKTLLLAILIFTAVIIARAQGITVVPNPDLPDIFGYTNGSPLSGYSGDPIEYNGNLYLQYQPATSTFSGDILQLAKYNANNTLTKIPNPDGGKGYVFKSTPIVFNGKLYIRYRNAAGNYQVGVYDGTSLTLIPNPTTVSTNQGYTDNPILYNGNLYILYKNAANVIVLAQVNTNNTITLIANPDASPYGYQGNPVVFNNKLYLNYIINGSNANVLAQYDGTATTLLPNPDNTVYGYQGNPVVYNNKLYVQYYGNAGQNQLMVYDGINNPSLIANVTTGSNNGYVGFPIVYNGILYFQYYTGTSRQLAKFNGTTITLIPNPDASPYGYWNVPIIYNNLLCFFYRVPSGVHQLATYNGGTSITLVPNPDASANGFWDIPIVYGNNLYYQYYNAAGTFQLGYYNGTAMTLIPNPAGYYAAYPLVFNNLLFMQFANVTYQNTGNLAYFNQASLPVKLLSFTAAKQKENTLVQWQTANEINNHHFEVERAGADLQFATIGSVKSEGAITPASYSFNDKSPLYGTSYYRLKQVDNDGKFTYSQIVSVYFPGITGLASIYPNPAVKAVTITLPPGNSISEITLYDMQGRKMLQTLAAANTVSKMIDVTTLPAGTYNVTIACNGQQQMLRLIKK